MYVLANERGAGTGAARALERRMQSTADDVMSHEPDAVMLAQLMQVWTRGEAYLAMAEQTGRAGPRSSLGKLALADYRYDLAELAVNASGAEGMLEQPRTRALLTTPGSWFAGGTIQVQRNIIGERVLGLPKEPKPPSAD